jgi:hypothetical protein
MPSRRSRSSRRNKTRGRKTRQRKTRQRKTRRRRGGARLALTGAELYAPPALPGSSGPYAGVFLDNELTDSVAGYRTFNTGVGSSASNINLALGSAAPGTTLPPA